jgi:hypothetical protein
MSQDDVLPNRSFGILPSQTNKLDVPATIYLENAKRSYLSTRFSDIAGPLDRTRRTECRDTTEIQLMLPASIHLMHGMH